MLLHCGPANSALSPFNKIKVLLPPLQTMLPKITAGRSMTAIICHLPHAACQYWNNGGFMRAEARKQGEVQGRRSLPGITGSILRLSLRIISGQLIFKPAFSVFVTDTTPGIITSSSF
jgi:hypothetical protein